MWIHDQTKDFTNCACDDFANKASRLKVLDLAVVEIKGNMATMSEYWLTDKGNISKYDFLFAF